MYLRVKTVLSHLISFRQVGASFDDDDDDDGEDSDDDP